MMKKMKINNSELETILPELRIYYSSNSIECITTSIVVPAMEIQKIVLLNHNVYALSSIKHTSDQTNDLRPESSSILSLSDGYAIGGSRREVLPHVVMFLNITNHFHMQVSLLVLIFSDSLNTPFLRLYFLFSLTTSKGKVVF